MLLATGDVSTDIAFTLQQLGTMHTVAEKAIAALLLLFLVLPIAASASQVRSVSVLLSRTLAVYQALYP